ncbi:MAG: TerB family tellurite resistance protein [Cyclobacteriaceae bacterium]|nr:TerB family tellurite resistance protein [Cyclobacteriaceae bacterium]
MNYSKKGWVSDYLAIREREFSEEILNEKFKKGLHPDQTLYSLIQPTGIMYGYPLKNLAGTENIDSDSKVRLLLIDTLLESYVLFRNRDLKNNIPFNTILTEGIIQVGLFYNAVYPELYTNVKTLFGQKIEPAVIVERILEKRIDLGSKNNFWSGFFHNSLLFLDIYFFRQWIHTPNTKIIVDYLKSQRDDIRSNVIKVMSAAAYANHNIEPEERRLFEYFINSLKLPSEKKKEAKDFFEKGYSINELTIPQDESWILRKYFLELSILTAWADRRVESIEIEFLEILNSRLGFNPEDLESSMIAVEGFVLNYWDEMDELQSKKEYEEVSHHYIERLERIVSKNRDRLYQEVYDRGSLLKLIKKAKTSEVTEKEMNFIKDQLIDSFESLPAFEIVALPRNFLTFDVLMEILPDDFFKGM